MKTQRTALLFVLLLLGIAALGTSAATAQTELFFATGVDSTGWALAQSNANGHVLIESPQYPRGLWLHLVDEAGEALAGIQVEYQGRPDSLVAIHCVDPDGGVGETMIWTRPEVNPLRLALKPREPADLPAGLVSIDWQIDTSVESLLEPVEETQLIGWEKVSAFLQTRWQGQTGRVAVQLDANTLMVEVDHPKDIEMLVAHLQQTQQPVATSLGEIRPLKIQVFTGSLGLREGVILFNVPLFEDSNLEEAVRQALDRVGQVSSLDSLSAVFESIHSLAGIEYFTALRVLDLEGNQIADLTPLKQLTNLKRLGLRGNQIVDITPLKQLTNLDFLSLADNQIADLTPLKQLTNLTDIYLDNNQIAQIADLTPLKQLTNLKRLGLRGNQIVDLIPLKQLTNLTDIYLDNNQIVDLIPLKQLTNLKRLYLDNNQIADLTPLEQLTHLGRLHLNNNRIVDLTPLEQLTHLGWVELANNQVADLTPLEQLNNLHWLFLDNNQIVDLTPLEQLDLAWLGLSGNRIVDLTPLKQLIHLEVLKLDNNQIADLSPLVTNTNIGRGDWMNVSDNPLSEQALKEQIPTLKARGVEVIY